MAMPRAAGTTLRVTAARPSPLPPKEEKKMGLLSVEINRERIRALEEELASLQWAAEVRRTRRETLRKVVADTGRATRQETGITLRRIMGLVTRG